MNQVTKKASALIGAGILSFGLSQTASGEEQQPVENIFSDIKQHSPVYETMESVFHMNIMSGYQDSSGMYYEMRPFESVTRAQTAKMMTASLGGKMATQEISPFTDVSEQHWAHDYVTIMNEKEIVGGYEDGTFKAQENLTRAQAAKMIVTAFNLPYDENELDTGFNDVSSDHWAAAYIHALVDAEITTGTSQTAFSPEENVTRYQLAAFIERSLNQSELSEDQIFLKVREVYGEFQHFYIRALQEGNVTSKTYEDFEWRFEDLVTDDYEPVLKKVFNSECALNGDCDGLRYTATLQNMFNKNIIEYSDERITIQYDEEANGLFSAANYVISIAKENGQWKLDGYEAEFYKGTKLKLSLTKEEALDHIESSYRLNYQQWEQVYSVTDIGMNEEGEWLIQLNTDGSNDEYVIRFNPEEGSFYY
ncbi:hypothetical protein KP77_28870 [Jeotgalibacillus alimentarius]|uniref:SLH domain-containing protein n=1 Tax=Jeotgalibacillus alimentarius TaxID=135826 RepID=A0A0C2VJK0_9BACL|nr:S-layer homology domain-containing protein [Jeotgalibacillus alimentarius]KIL44666.1 hypothetical protein KP77_28870 [Jeotgalibacillus alimentarius]